MKHYKLILCLFATALAIALATILLGSTVIGGLDDQTGFLAWETITKQQNFSTLMHWRVYQDVFYYFIHPFNSNEPILALFLSTFLRIPFVGYLNVFIVLTVIANLFIAYSYFKRYKFGIFYAILFCFSPYFLSHVGIHVSLMQIWLVPLFFIASELEGKKGFLLMVLVLVLSVLISNYLGYFIFLTFVLKISLGLFIEKKSRSLTNLGTLLISGLFLIFILGPFIKINYLEKTTAKEISGIKPFRTLDDFVTFSARPWYFVLPSIKNPILGSLTETALQKIRARNYFLNDDYFAGEHQGDYLGIFLLLTVLVFVYHAFFNPNFLQKKEVILNLILIAVLFVLMMPPYFTFHGVIYYLPSYLLFKFFSMFRVTARLSLIVLFVLLDTLGRTYTKGRVFIMILTLVTLVETFVPVKFVHMQAQPAPYAYLAQMPAGSKFAVFPYSQTQDAIYYIRLHGQYLVNPRGYLTDTFDAETFTKSLLNREFLLQQKSKVDYLLIQKGTNFGNLDLLTLQKDFSDFAIYSIK